MTAPRTKRRRNPKGRAPKVQPQLTPEEIDERRETLKKIANTVRRGRPPIYDTAFQLQDAIDDYFQSCTDNGLLPTVAGMQYHIGMYGADIWEEIKRRGEGFSNVASATKLRMLDYKFQAAAAGAMDRGVYIFDAVNHHNHVNTRTESKNDNRNTGRLEIEAIAINLCRPEALPPASGQVIEAEIVNPQISATTSSDDAE